MTIRGMSGLLRLAVMSCVFTVAASNTLRAGPITYQVTVDATAYYGFGGSLDFDFAPGDGSQAAFVTIANFSPRFLSEEVEVNGGVSGDLFSTLTIDNSTQFNDYFVVDTFYDAVLFDTVITFLLTFDGPAVASPNGASTSGSTFAFGLFDPGPVLTTDPNGNMFTVDVNLDGTTTVTTFPSDANGGAPAATLVSLTDAPEPSTLVMFALGLSGLVAWRGRRRRGARLAAAAIVVPLTLSAQLTDVSSQVRVTTSGFPYSRVTGSFNGTITVTNIGAQAIPGPLEVVLTQLAAGVRLGNSEGDVCGSPFVTLAFSGALAPSQHSTAPVQFADGSFVPIAFTAVTWSLSPNAPQRPFHFTVQPGNTSVGAVISPVQVVAQDSQQHPLSGVPVTLSLGPNPPNPGLLTGTLTRFTDATGTATFADLKLDYVGQCYTLAATASTPGGFVSGTSNPFNETPIGDPCLGPNPACASGCADSDGDGLNDAWEIAGGIDLNGDGKIDPHYDLLLPGADPNKPDIYVHYDWMDYGHDTHACNADADCGVSHLGTGHLGETCSGPPVPAGAHSCSFACTADTQCTARGAGHAGERCIANACLHTHDPEALAPGAIDAVASKFLERGFNLHVERGHALPHSQVLSFRPLSSVTDACEGGSVASGWAGPGNYVESMYDLKAQSFDPKKNVAYHYAIFGHYNSCDADAHCNLCPGIFPIGGSPTMLVPPFGASGVAEIGGNDFIVSLAVFFNDKNAGPTIMNVGGTFMHELGHNLGLRHGGGSDLNSDAEDTPNFKPNYLSVMNYKFQLPGIVSGAALGSSVPVSSRLDYSTQTLPTGGNTPGRLDENNLNEPAGLGSGSADITSFDDGACGFGFHPTNGPLDFDGDGYTIGTNVSADLIRQDHPRVTYCPTGITQLLVGHTDWGPAQGQSIFTYKFQCNPLGASNGVTAPARLAQNELTAEVAEAAHVLYPIRAVRVVIKPGCSAARKPIAPGQPGQFTTALLGSADFDVNDVEPSSLKMHGARPLSVTLTDTDGDGRLDLVVVFDTADVRLQSSATSAQVTGWLKNSQVFTAEDQVIVVPSTALMGPMCR